MKHIKSVAQAAFFGAMMVCGVESAGAQDTPQAGDILLRVRALGVLPDERSTVSVIGGKVDAANTLVPELDFSYFFGPNISAELVAAVTRHRVKAERTSLGTVELGKAWLLPPTLTLQYHFDADRVRPYVGVGFNYTAFFSTKRPSAGPVTSIHYGDSVGPALQAGIDIPLQGRWSFNADLKRVWLKSNVAINGGAIKATAHLDPWLVGVGVGYRF